MMRAYFKDMKTLAAWMLDMSKEGDVVAAFHYHDACKLLSEIITQHGSFGSYSLELHDPRWELYSGEYYITLANDCDELFVEKAMNGDKYLIFDANTLILAPDASSVIATKNAIPGTAIEAVFENDEDLLCDECDLCACDCDDCFVEDPEDEDDDDDDAVTITVVADGEEKTSKMSMDDFLDLLWDMIDF